MALGLIPRSRVVHTHADHEGQLYVPLVNWALLGGCLVLVMTFKSSTNLAAAYGLAVALVMLITVAAVAIVARRDWHWKWTRSIAIFAPAILITAMFVFANMFKLIDGGWVPLGIGSVLTTTMFCWQWGRREVARTFDAHRRLTMAEVLDHKRDSHNFPKSVLMLTPHHVELNEDLAPSILQIFFKRYHTLPRHLILLTVKQERVPHIAESDRYRIAEFENNHDGNASLLSIEVRFGYMENPDLETVITDIATDKRLSPDSGLRNWIIHVGKDRVVGHSDNGLFANARFLLYKTIARNAEPAYVYFGLSDDARLTVEYIPVPLGRKSVTSDRC